MADRENIAPSHPALPHGVQELILIVDDEAPSCAATQRLIEEHDYNVAMAADGREIIDVFLNRKWGMKSLLTDLMIPSVNGVTLIHVLRVTEPCLNVVAPTGLQDRERNDELAALVVTEVLAKPCSTADMLHGLRRQMSSGK